MYKMLTLLLELFYTHDAMKHIILSEFDLVVLIEASLFFQSSM